MKSRVRSILLTCAFGTTLPIGGVPVQAQEATTARPADRVVVDPSLTTVRIEAFFETTDGSAQIGMVVDRVHGGRVKFQYCNGQTVDLAEKDIRRSEARCSGSGGRGKGTWTVNYEGGLGELVSGNSTIPCDDLAPSLRSALATAASTPSQVGTIFSPVGPSGTSVEATSSTTTDGSAFPVAQTVPAGCPAATDVMAIELAPWTSSTANASMVGVYVDDMAVGAAATGQ